MQRQDPGALASKLQGQLKDRWCVVKLVHGADHLGMARMEVEDIYVDDHMPDTAVFRVVGRHTHGPDHAMLGLPLGGAGGGVDAQFEGGHVSLAAGDFQLVIHPDGQGLEGER